MNDIILERPEININKQIQDAICKYFFQNTVGQMLKKYFGLKSIREVTEKVFEENKEEQTVKLQYMKYLQCYTAQIRKFKIEQEYSNFLWDIILSDEDEFSVEDMQWVTELRKKMTALIALTFLEMNYEYKFQNLFEIWAVIYPDHQLPCQSRVMQNQQQIDEDNVIEQNSSDHQISQQQQYPEEKQVLNRIQLEIEQKLDDQSTQQIIKKDIQEKSNNMDSLQIHKQISQGFYSPSQDLFSNQIEEQQSFETQTQLLNESQTKVRKVIENKNISQAIQPPQQKPRIIKQVRIIQRPSYQPYEQNLPFLNQKKLNKIQMKQQNQLFTNQQQQLQNLHDHDMNQNNLYNPNIQIQQQPLFNPQLQLLQQQNQNLQQQQQLLQQQQQQAYIQHQQQQQQQQQQEQMALMQFLCNQQIIINNMGLMGNSSSNNMQIPFGNFNSYDQTPL